MPTTPSGTRTLLRCRPLGSFCLAQGLAHRRGQRGHGAQVGGYAGQALGGEAQAVVARVGFGHQGQIPGIFGQQKIGFGHQRIGQVAQQGVDGGRGEGGQRRGWRAGWRRELQAQVH